MRIVCWQTILLKYHTLFLSKIRKDVAKFVACCSLIGALRVNYGIHLLCHLTMNLEASRANTVILHHTVNMQFEVNLLNLKIVLDEISRKLSIANSVDPDQTTLYV